MLRGAMHLTILYHGNCFDGCASAALFGRFMAEREGSRLGGVVHRPMAHKQGDPFPADAFAGPLNACLDFRYSSDPGLHWWFDHHASAFMSPDDQATFEHRGLPQHVWDPRAPSCTGLIARTLRARHGWEARGLEELIRWAEVIDAASFPSAAMAVRLEEPALKVMTLLEATHDPAIPDRIIEAMRDRPLGWIVEQPWATEPLAPLLERHQEAIALYRKLARLEQGVVQVDLLGSGVESANKFIAYESLPGGALHGGPHRGPEADQGLGRLQPVAEGAAHPRPRRALPALWRRRPSGGGRGDPAPRARRRGPAHRRRDRRRPAPRGAGMTPGQYILVVDDDDDFRTALCEVLAQAGYPVAQAASGEDALVRLDEETPGLVLLDLKMPGIDGWGVIERMRAEPRWAAIPVLILSAYGYEWEAELLGVQGYIPKADVKLDGILARVRTAAGDPPMRH